MYAHKRLSSQMSEINVLMSSTLVVGTTSDDAGVNSNYSNYPETLRNPALRANEKRKL